jgi:glycosyltransferase involved in cell wall biosynthesis
VLFLASTFPRSGEDPSAPYLADLAQALAKRDATVSVLCPHDRGTARHEAMGPVEVQRFRYAPARLERLAYRGGLLRRSRTPLGALLVPGFLAAFVLGAIARTLRFRPHVVHAHWWFPAGVAGLVASRVAGVPLVVTLHGSDVHLARGGPLRLLARAVLRRAAVVTAVSEALAEEATPLVGRRTVRITRMPWARPGPGTGPTGRWGDAGPRHAALVPPRPPAAAPPGQAAAVAPGQAARALRLAAVGRLSPEKGFDVLLDAVHLLRCRGVDVTLELAGDGPERDRLAAKAETLGPRVRLLGGIPRHALSAVLGRADAVVVPSRREGLGLVALDALGAGRPVVASRVGGLPEVVQEPDDGVLVPPGDPRALADALERLPLRAPAARALGRHDPGRVATEHLDAYEEATRVGAPRWPIARLVGAAAGLAVLAALVAASAHDLPVVARDLARATLVPVSIAIAAQVAAEVGYAIASALALATLREHVGFSRAASAFLVAQTAKHLPGGVGAPLARAGVASRFGLAPRRTGAWLVVEAVASVAATLWFGAVALAVTLGSSRAAVPHHAAGAGAGQRLAWVAVALVALGVPFVLSRRAPTGRLAERLLGPLPAPRVLARPAGAYLAVTATSAVALAGLARSLAPLGDRAMAELAGAFAVATVVGFLALPVPAGLGVREAVFVALAAPLLPAPLALAVALAQRVLAMLAQSLLALLAAPALRRRVAESTSRPSRESFGDSEHLPGSAQRPAEGTATTAASTTGHQRPC